MSSDFKTVLIKDSTIADITSDMSFPVESGASSTTYQPFPATSTSNSSLIFQVQVPSENIVIDRHVLIQTGLTFTLNIGGAGYIVPAGEACFNYGETDSFQAFPLSSIMSVATAQINNTSASINLKDCLPQLLRMNDSRELYRFNSLAPSLPDQAYATYSDAVGANNNPMAGYANASYDVDQVPRGAWPATITIARYVGGVYQDANPVAQVGDATETWKVVVQSFTTEPLFLSPFIFSNPEYNAQGFLGINNMNFNFTIDSTLARLWSSSTGYISSITAGNVAIPAVGLAAQSNIFTTTGASPAGAIVNTTTQLLFRFLSTQPSDSVMSRNVVPYTDYSRYLTQQGNNTPIASGGRATLLSSNLQINQIPSLFIIVVRKPMASQNWNDTASFLTISNVSINLNNSSGLLASAQSADLWRLSQRNGSSQSWAEFSGQQQVVDAQGGLDDSPITKRIGTTGSMLVLNPSFDLSLPDYLSAGGSIGNYNFQFQVSVYNQYGETVTPEICVIAVNSGLMSTSQGTSNLYTGILTKEAVLACKAEKAHPDLTSLEYKRMVGGKMLNRAIHHMMRRRGGHSSGGSVSAGGVSGGKHKLHGMY